jgi:NAD(P)-dependent dehydrogenase (short-subunit alcohol dehydrogenase family)
VDSRYGSAVTATISGVLDQLRPSRPIGRLEAGDRLDGELCLVTGANAGIGRAVATLLCRRGARVVMAGRTLDDRARDEVVRRSGGGWARLEHLDLGRLASVAAFCDRMRADGQRFAVVVANAGVVPKASRRTVDGLEESFQVNYLANVLLLGRLFADGCLGRAAVQDGNDGKTCSSNKTDNSRNSRIVFVSSEAHRSGAPVDWDRLGSFEPYGLKGSVAEYCRVKLLLTTYAVELARRLEPEVSVHALCPGAVRTRIGREAPWWAQPALQLTMRVFFRSPERGAEPAVFLSCASSVEGRTGIYLHGMTEKPVSPAAADPENGRRLWEASHCLLAERGFALPEAASHNPGSPSDAQAGASS